MKKNLWPLIPFLFIISMFLASQNAAAMSTNPVGYDVCNLYTEELDSIDKVMAWSTNIVKAKLLDCEDFNGYVRVYHFEIKKDYTANTPPEIYVYDDYNENYHLGHTYYLFLESYEDELYPHTVYTSVKKELIIDFATGQALDYSNSPIKLYLAEVEPAINDALANNIAGSKLICNNQICE